MRIKYLGHSCFLFTSESNISVLIDPYKLGAYGGALNYSPISETADIVVISHEHEDHAEYQNLPNHPLVIRTSAQAQGIGFDVISTYHDAEQGNRRGVNRVTCFEMDGIRVCHLGDLGHVLNSEQVQAVGKVDLLLIPVGGTFTLGPAEADQVVEQIQPAIVVPMHFKTARCAFPIETAEPFLAQKNPIRRSTVSEVILHKEDIPCERTFLYMPPANAGILDNE